MTKNCRAVVGSGKIEMSQASGAAPVRRISAPGWLRRSMPQSVSRGRSSARRVPRPSPARASEHAERTEASTAPLYASVLGWLLEMLPHGAFHRPACKRLALLVTGLLAGETATTSGLADILHGLAISSAQELSIHRRITRSEADPQLDPRRVLPALFRPLLPILLKTALSSHAANEPSGAHHHARFLGVRLVLDGSSKGEAVHFLTLGLADQGLVLPLAVRCWEQNAPLPTGEYRAQVLSLLSEVNLLLPPDLRDHVLFLADRLYGTSPMLDLLGSVGWHWVLRVQGQTRVCNADGTEWAVATLAPAPGRIWVSESDLPPDPTTPIAAFKQAGWRPCRVVAAWLEGQAEPWLLVTDLVASAERLADYAQRWAIERLFLSWKSHGFDLEAVGIGDPLRLSRLLTGLVVATLWRLAAAAPVARRHLADLAHRTPRPRQLPLPLESTQEPSVRATPPWPAKFSLFTWGTKTFHQLAPRSGTPELCWAFPGWDEPPWSQQCWDAYYQGAA